MSAYQDKVEIGDCTLYLGDAVAVLPEVGFVPAIVTDWPYGIADKPLVAKRQRGKTGDYHKPSVWDRSFDPRWARACAQATRYLAVFRQWRKREEIAGYVGKPLRCEIVWAKSCHMGPPSPVAARDERIWVFADRKVEPATFETSVWDHPVIPTWEQKHHKNEKPVTLMERLLRWGGHERVCDPFMGSGTTGVAALKLQRGFIGIERDPDHFAAACRRIEAAHKRPHQASLLG